MKIILSCLLTTVLIYGSDIFYVKANDEGTLAYLITNNEIEGYKSTNSIASSYEFHNLVEINRNTTSKHSENSENKFNCTTIHYTKEVDTESSLCQGSHVFYSLSAGKSVAKTVAWNLLGIPLVTLQILSLQPKNNVFDIVGSEKSYYFDNEKYNEFVKHYDLENSKNKLFSDIEHTRTTKFIPCDLSAYNDLDYASITPATACKHNVDEGLFFFHTNKGIFSDSKTQVVGLFGAEELNQPLKVTQKIVQSMIETHMDILSEHPEIPLPIALPKLVLEKSQFEKEVDFNKRKNIALLQREKEQKELNENYIDAVKKRNMTIFKELGARKATLKEKIVEFRKQAFMAVATSPKFKFESYDAENEKLYGEFSFGDNDYRVVSSNIPSKLAMKVHDQPEVIIPQVNYELLQSGDSANFEIKELTLFTGSDKLKFDFTDNRYQPPSMALVIPSYNISAFQDGIADANKEAATISSSALKALQDLERYRVKSQLAISDTSIHHINAKAPNWYENLNCGNEQCAVGRGETQKEALKVSLAQLGCIMKSSVSSDLLIQQTVTNDIVEQKKVNYTIQESCSNSFDEGALSITNMAEMDGWYYLRAILNTNQNKKSLDKKKKNKTDKIIF